MTTGLRRTLFALFLVSGFCAFSYQIIWMRMALSSFGVITPVVSVVVSVFMLGLSLGSWLGGRWVRRITASSGISAIAYYGICEALIAAGAFLLPLLFAAGRSILLPIQEMGSTSYLLLSATVIVVSMLPWCTAMGATFPCALCFVKEVDRTESASFSYLYLANVIGALCGALLTSFVLIELFGFQVTLWINGALNLGIAATSALLWRQHPSPKPGLSAEMASSSTPTASSAPEPSPELARARSTSSHVAPELGLPTWMIHLLLFTTGFCAMALEIVWLRAFTPVLGTLVYSFSGLVAAYLAATWVGSLSYRRNLTARRVLPPSTLVTCVALTSLFPIFAADPRVASLLAEIIPEATSNLPLIVLALASILPFCALLGYLTPMLIDGCSSGRPGEAGIAYAINTVGSILGPLCAAYLLLPAMGARFSMLTLAAPFALLFPVTASMPRRTDEGERRAQPPMRQRLATAATALVVLGLGAEVAFRGTSYEEGAHLGDAVVLRDHTATVISYGQGLQSRLLVNGHGMTTMSSVTKVMAHLPLASLGHEPESALVVAFGMGTTYRSLLTWDIRVTAVELIPSVVEAFDYFFPDAEQARNDPNGRIVVDDGRRFLARTEQRFDVITVDPPPPVEAAGSSLLYAEEFYQLAKSRLVPGGILQHWFPDSPGVEPATRRAALRSALNSFPHVRVFRASWGTGLHILCSVEPIQIPEAGPFSKRLPARARRDLMEWFPPRHDAEQFIAEKVLANELDLKTLIDDDDVIAITDDHPFNEYFVLRRFAL